MESEETLPEDVRQDAEETLRRVGSILKYGAEATAEAKPPGWTVFLLLTLGLGIIAYIIAEISNYYEIRRNWSTYRCLPSVAPFARFYGHNLTENMNFCVGQAVREHAPGVIAPIYSGIARATAIVDGVYEKVEAVEGGVAGLLSGFETFVINFVNSFRLLGTRIQISVIRIRDIFSRLHGMFMSFVYAGISTLVFGENLVCNPLVVFIGDIAGADLCCFAPDTRIQMDDGGGPVPVTDVGIGDVLAGGARVTGRLLFDGRATKMFRLYGVTVSGNHCVRHDGAWIAVSEHPDAEAAESLDNIWCLNTTTNMIPVVSERGGILTFTDYEETAELTVAAKAQRAAELLLNGTAGPAVPDFALGLDPEFWVPMDDGECCLLRSLRLGDRLKGGATVVGVIVEECTQVCQTEDGCWISAAQLVLRNGVWTRAARIWPSLKAQRQLCHLMIANGGPFSVVGPSGAELSVRDYNEVVADAVQAPYDSWLENQERFIHVEEERRALRSSEQFIPNYDLYYDESNRAQFEKDIERYVRAILMSHLTLSAARGEILSNLDLLENQREIPLSDKLKHRIQEAAQHVRTF